MTRSIIELVPTRGQRGKPRRSVAVFARVVQVPYYDDSGDLSAIRPMGEHPPPCHLNSYASEITLGQQEEVGWSSRQTSPRTTSLRQRRLQFRRLDDYMHLCVSLYALHETLQAVSATPPSSCTTYLRRINPLKHIILPQQMYFTCFATPRPSTPRPPTVAAASDYIPTNSLSTPPARRLDRSVLDTQNMLVARV